MSQQSNSITYSFGGAFSMGNSKRQDLNHSNQTPGPGAYNNDSVIINSPRNPIYVIPKSPRKPIFQEKGVPPPGTYEPVIQIGQGQKVSMSQYRFKEHGDKYDIGPGSYDVIKAMANKQSSPQFSFSSRYDELKPTLQTPGPGAYNLPEIGKDKLYAANKSTMSSNFNNSSLKRIKSEDSFIPAYTPGPGEYHQDQFIKNQFGTTFAKSGRMMIKSNDTPGPGQFEIVNYLKDQNKNFTLGSKIAVKDTYKSIVPGPGTYNLSQTGNKPTIKIGASKRIGLVQSDTPGPGSYSGSMYARDDSFQGILPENRGLSYSRRPDLINNKKSPGPGNYNLPEYMGKSTQVKISQNNNQGKWKIKSDVPGPGSYNITNSGFDYTKGAKLKGKRNTMDQSSFIPGPGSYDISYNSMSPKFSFTHQSRYKQDIRQLFEPSPGQYEIAGTIANVPQYLQYKKSS